MANEALRVRCIDSLKDAFPFDLDALRVTEMDRGRGMESNSGMAVLVVVPLEETSAEGTAIFDRAETVRELWPVLEGFELGL